MLLEREKEIIITEHMKSKNFLEVRIYNYSEEENIYYGIKYEKIKERNSWFETLEPVIIFKTDMNPTYFNNVLKRISEKEEELILPNLKNYKTAYYDTDIGGYNKYIFINGYCSRYLPISKRYKKKEMMYIIDKWYQNLEKVAKEIDKIIIEDLKGKNKKNNNIIEKTIEEIAVS